MNMNENKHNSPGHFQAIYTQPDRAMPWLALALVVIAALVVKALLE